MEPGNGPNYIHPEVVCARRIDNDHDVREDLIVEFRFSTSVRLPSVFTSFVGAGYGINAPANAPPDLNGNATAGTPVVPPAIASLRGEESTGLSLRQS